MKFIYGQEEYLINVELNKFIRSFNIQPNTYSSNEELDEIMMDINTISMFDISKLIIIKDHVSLYDDKLGEAFFNELEKANLSEVNICFIANEKISNKNKLIKYLLSNADVQEIKEIKQKDISEIIKHYVSEKNGTITNSAIIKMTQKLPMNLRIIITELEKLLLENNNITDEQVEKSIGEYNTEDYFAFSNAIVENDKRRIYALYKEKISLGEQPPLIIGQIASSLNLSVLVSFYKKQGFSLSDISDKTKIHIFRIKRANELLRKTSAEEIKKLVIELGDLDAQIKTGQIDSLKGMDRFILQMIK